LFASIAVRALSEQSLFREMVAPDRWQEGYWFGIKRARAVYREQISKLIADHFGDRAPDIQIGILTDNILAVLDRKIGDADEQKG